MKERITPVGLKGYEINERMKELMGITPINENKKSSVIELTKKGPDGKIYGIVRENHEYYIKISKKQDKSLVAEDFSYIGGLQNKKQEAYSTYAKAIKHLNLKFNSLNEAYGKSGQINVFETDGYGMGECGDMNEFGEPAFNHFSDDIENLNVDALYRDAYDEMNDITTDELSPEMLAVDELMYEEEEVKEEEVKPVTESKLSIERAINEMDEIIDFISKPRKKKVYTLK